VNLFITSMLILVVLPLCYGRVKAWDDEEEGLFAERCTSPAHLERPSRHRHTRRRAHPWAIALPFTIERLGDRQPRTRAIMIPTAGAGRVPDAVPPPSPSTTNIAL